VIINFNFSFFELKIKIYLHLQSSRVTNVESQETIAQTSSSSTGGNFFSNSSSALITMIKLASSSESSKRKNFATTSQLFLRSYFDHIPLCIMLCSYRTTARHAGRSNFFAFSQRLVKSTEISFFDRFFSRQPKI
jgi:hypothetical protein